MRRGRRRAHGRLLGQVRLLRDFTLVVTSVLLLSDVPVQVGNLHFTQLLKLSGGGGGNSHYNLLLSLLLQLLLRRRGDAPACRPRAGNDVFPWNRRSFEISFRLLSNSGIIRV